MCLQCEMPAAAPSSISAPLAKRREREACRGGVRAIGRQKMGEGDATARNRFESAGPPAAVEIDTFHGRLVDDGRGVVHHIDDAGPLAQQPQAAEAGEELEEPAHHPLQSREIASLSVGGVQIEAAARRLAHPCPTG